MVLCIPVWRSFRYSRQAAAYTSPDRWRFGLDSQTGVGMARIFVVGSGVVGTATGRGFADAGHRVTFVDVLDSRIEQLRSEGFDATNRLNLGDEPAFVFLTLPTPHDA